MSDRPNILFLQTDQLSAPALQAYGGLAITPTIDRLASQGVLFEDAYCNYPLCAPSRFSMMAGKLASRIGAYDNGAEFPSSIPTFAHYLRAAGYRTCLSGKMHFVGADQLHGFDERLTSDIYPGDFAWAADWGGEKKGDTNSPILIEKAGLCTGSVQIDYDEQVAEKACTWLEENGKPGADPFLLAVSFTHPHDPYVCPDPYWSWYDDIDIPLPDQPPADDPHSQLTLKSFGMAGITFSAEQITTARRGYLGSCSYIDAKIGEVLDALEKTGQANNTIIVLTSDHGDMLGQKGLWMKKVFFEPALKVPLIVHAPSRFKSQRKAGLVSLVDLLPTLMGLVGCQDDPVLAPDGIDLSRYLDYTPLPDRPLLVEQTCEGTPGPMLMIRRGNLKYIWSSEHPPMLFDLAIDPGETVNRAEDPAYMARAKALEDEIFEHWNPEALASDVRQSQRQRNFIQRAHKSTGTAPNWDFVLDAADDEKWMRGQVSYNDWAFGSITGNTPAPGK